MYKLQNIEFLHPWLLLLLLVIPFLYWWNKYKTEKTKAYIPMPSLQGLGKNSTNWKILLYKLMPYLKLAALSLLILAFARPRLSLKQESVNAEGIDIVLAIDVSTSMLATDFKPDRLEASKKVAIDFINNRPYDRIGLVVFSGEAFTFSPVTTDHDLLVSLVEQIQTGSIKDGTAIGNGLAAAVNRLKNSKSKSKVIILLTDGVNNSGYVDPETATELAKENGIKVYTIGVGSQGMANSPVGRQFGRLIYGMARVEIDERLLTNIAKATQGMYFRAKNENELAKIYDYIDKLEKTKIEVKVFKRYSEEFRFFLIPGLLLLLLILLLKKTLLRTIV